MQKIEVSETQFLLAHCRNELIRAWHEARKAGATIVYREWKRRRRTLRAIRETLEAPDA